MGKIQAKGFVNKNGDQIEMIPTAHTHVIADVTELQTELNNKAATTHTHTIQNITNLQTELTNLQTELNNKADTSHVHSIENITGLSETISELETNLHTKFFEFYNPNEIIWLPELFSDPSYNNTSITILLHTVDEDRPVQDIFKSENDEDIAYLENWCSDVALMNVNSYTLYVFRVIFCEEALYETPHEPSKYFIMLDGKLTW